jgi:starch synthase
VRAVQDVPMQLGARKLWFSASTTALPKSQVRVWFVRCPELFDREGIYTQDADEHVRFALLSRAAIELCQWTKWAPDVFHVNDWHTALVPLYLRTVYGWDQLFRATRTLLAIHNIGYQGTFGDATLDEVSLGNERRFLYQEDLREGRVNWLKTGVLYSTTLTTVSRTYAREIQTAEFGLGLDDVLRRRAESLFGIVNGVDYGEWDPATDPHLAHHYDARDLDGKVKSRAALAVRAGLSADPRAPVIGMISRLTHQKGFELLPEVLPVILSRHGARAVVLGSGEKKYEDFFRWLAQNYPGRAFYSTGYDEPLAHQIEAGADMFLMPSRYEPCGLNQMYSLRYGTVPIVRRTGGLADTVAPFDARTGEGTGFLFDEFQADALLRAVQRALEVWRDPAAWARLVQNGMAQDFSWDRQGPEYVALYRRLAAR